MEYRTLGRCGVKVSRLCLGTMMFGGPTDEGESIRIIHRALDEGINFIDTADMYAAGASEEITGKALRGRWDRVVLATKVRNPMGEGPNDAGLSRYHILNAVEASLRRLGTDHIDIYYLHAPDYDTPLEESLAAMDDLVHQGKVRYVGCSNFYAWQVCEALWISDRRRLAPLACVQPLYNIVNRDAEVELFPLCQKHGLGVVPYSPLARGVLTGKYVPGAPYPDGSRAARGDRRMHQAELRTESFEVAQKLKPVAARKGCPLTQFALAWVLANPIVTSVILGPRTMEQFEDNLGCLSLTVTPEDERDVDALVPPGEHTGWGFNDPAYPVRGRPVPQRAVESP
ncbi:MAG: aldo/keto reductase [Armatimonadota bacterium]|jgi:aryl-alcohol dehydrogenase-like predicted oxidoreductase|nr:aldo/keto reductase [Armatimonadota bacterium]